jgi:predicted acyl esterase
VKDGPKRFRWRRVIVVVAAALVVPTVWVPAANAAAGPATFVVQGSVEQFAVTHATPGATITLDDGHGQMFATGTLDAQGSFLFRNVPAGGGYRAIEDDGGTITESAPTKVLSPTFVPPPRFYKSQQLQIGFGYITMRDGTKLSAEITLPGPADAGPYPTVIEYSGYDPSHPGSPQPSTLLAQLLGYATVGVNIRGTGCSGGSYSYFEQLQSLDGYDVVEAVAAQPWVAHHKVGMVGISYPGISQLFVGQTQPPDLEAIAPLSTIADTYRSTLYPGGIFNNGFALSWAQDRQNSGKPYGEGWEQSVVDAGGPNGQQCAENQLLRLQNPDIIAQINDNPYYSPTLGDPLSPITFVNKINVPVFLGGAWQDEQVGPQSADMLDQFTSSPDKHFMFTNGTHVESLFAQLQRWTEFLDFYVGHRIPHVPASFRALAPTIYQAGIGISGITLPPDRFDGYSSYARALAAYQAEPDVRILFENGYGDPARPGTPIAAFEHDFSQWPPAETVPTTWYFQPDQQLSPTPTTIPDGDGRASTSYVYDPTAKPVTDYSGSSSAIWGANPTYDWRPLPLGKALAFDSAPLKQNVTMVGTGSVNLWLRSTAPDTDLEVTITELRPDGMERYVQSGWLRASHRALDPTRTTATRPWHTDTQADAAPLPAGQFVEARVELMPFAAVFRKGSQIRITVEAPGGNRPFWTFDSLPAGGTVINDIAHSVGRPSQVVLPVIPGISVPTPLPPCPSLRGQPCRTTFGNATPTSVDASAGGGGAAKVTWVAPGTVRPGDTISGYTVHESPGGVEVTTSAGIQSVKIKGLPAGPHFFSVEADYSGGGTSGVSTPSHTITVGAAVQRHYRYPGFTER